ncbi:MAG: 50S ribosomal protein L21 [Thermodesulfovibrionia bacterium]
MFAIIETGGKQYRVSDGEILNIEKIGATDSVTFDKVLMVSDGDKVVFGNPYIPNAVVTADVLETKKADKVLVFKQKPRKGFRRLRGHRQLYTKVRINSINMGG